MIKFKNIIARIKKKRNMKWVLMFLVLGLVFVGKTYAADGDFSSIDWFARLLNLLLSLASWVWIIFANLAGKLMTNDLVYGSFLHLDASLWKLWNIIKNFANFGLGFMVLFAIVKSIFSFSGDAVKKPLGVIKNALIAGVLIQMSWFLMGAVIDVSTIMTSAIAAFPSQFVHSNSEFQGHFYNNLREIPKGKMKFDPANEGEIVDWEEDENSTFANMDDDELNGVIDTLMPGHDSMSGPLIFLGLSVFDFSDFQKYSSTFGENSTVNRWSDLFVDFSLSAIVLVSFTVMMFLIFLFNLFRILMLRIIIPLMPVIILLKVFKIEKLDNLGFLSEAIKVENIIKLIFKPVLMVGALSLVLVILVLVENMINPKTGTQIPLTPDGSVVIESQEVDQIDDVKVYDSTIKSDGIIEFSMSGVKNGFADLIVYFLGLFLIFFVVKIAVSFKTGIGFIDKSLDNLFKGFTNLATSIPVVPIPGGGAVGIGAFKDTGADLLNAPLRLAGMEQERERQRSSLGLTEGVNYFANLSTDILNKKEFLQSAIGIAKGYTNVFNSGADVWDDDNFQAILQQNKDVTVIKKDVVDYWNNYEEPKPEITETEST